MVGWQWWIYKVVLPFVILTFLSGLSKALTRGTKMGWPDFMLGVELTFGTVTGCLLEAIDKFDLMKRMTSIDPNSTAFEACFRSVSFGTLSLVLFIAVAKIHQHYETDDQGHHHETYSRHQLWWLCGLGNFIGCGLLLTFLIYVKGV